MSREFYDDVTCLVTGGNGLICVVLKAFLYCRLNSFDNVPSTLWCCLLINLLCYYWMCRIQGRVLRTIRASSGKSEGKKKLCYIAYKDIKFIVRGNRDKKALPASASN